MTTGLANIASRGAFTTVMWQMLRLIIQFASIIVMARLVDPASFGLIAMVLSIIGISEIFRDLGLSLASVQADQITHFEKSNLFWVNAVVGLLLSTVTAGLAVPLSFFYREPEIVSITLMLCPIYFLNGLAAQFRAEMNRNMQFSRLNASDALPYVVGLGVGISFAVAGSGVVALVLQQVAISVSGLAIAVILSKWWPSWPKRKHSIRKFLAFGISTTGIQTLYYLTRNVDNIAIGAVWGANPLGFYSRAYQVVILPFNLLLTPFTRLTLPVLSRVITDRQQFLHYLRIGYSTTSLGTAVAFGLLAGVATPLVEVVLGSAWLPMVFTLQILTAGAIFRSTAQALSWGYYAQGLPAKLLKLASVTQPLIIFLMLCGLPWGPVGVAIGSSSGYLLQWILASFWANRHLGVEIRSILCDSATTTLLIYSPLSLFSLISSKLSEAAFSQLLISTLAGAFYILLACALFSPVRRQVRQVFHVIGKARGKPRSQRKGSVKA